MVGRFQGATQKYTPIDGIEIVWINGLPIDQPKCGFRGELCKPKES